MKDGDVLAHSLALGKFYWFWILECTIRSFIVAVGVDFLVLTVCAHWLAFAAESSVPTSSHSDSVPLQSDRRQSGPAAAEEACRCLLTLQEIDSF